MSGLFSFMADTENLSEEYLRLGGHAVPVGAEAETAKTARALDFSTLNLSRTS